VPTPDISYFNDSKAADEELTKPMASLVSRTLPLLQG
jgi:hypothetical protein